jgi:site-specific DNA recombinase
MTMPLRAALYLRVSTARQAEHDVSIPEGRSAGRKFGSCHVYAAGAYVG